MHDSSPEHKLDVIDDDRCWQKHSHNALQVSLNGTHQLSRQEEDRRQARAVEAHRPHEGKQGAEEHACINIRTTRPQWMALQQVTQ